MIHATSNWATHDFTVKMLDWSAVRGSRLAYTCRRCGRQFCQFAAEGRKAWAIDAEYRALEGKASDRWLSEECPRLVRLGDDEDRMLPSSPIRT
jgi:hypothetical protein